MKISDIYDLEVDQVQLDFVNIEINRDYPLYIDPYLISTRSDPWSVEVDGTIKSFFSKVVDYIRNSEHSKAIELFRFMSEPKETCLGISKTGTKNGRGVGQGNATDIINEIIKSKAIETGVVQNIEDIVVFVDDIDKDKLSDMTTNIIRKHLIDYTKEQCKIWGISLFNQDSLPYWNRYSEDWEISKEDLLFYQGRELLLVPKAIVSYISEYNAQKYGWHFVVTNERDEQLARRSSLVKFKKYKNGKGVYYLPKKDVDNQITNQISNGDFESRKDYLRQYTQSKPELFDRFRNSKSKEVKSLTNDEFMKHSGSVSIDKLVDALIVSLKSIPIGTKNASEYQKYIKSILEILFYPHLNNPIIEEKIHQGRKRVDIVMSNIALGGFFHRLHNINKIPCGYIFIECKNYSKDVANPEIDQLSGRFSFNKGKFGILMCRNIDNKELLYQRCSDTYKNDNGLIIPLDDNDIIFMLESLKGEKDEVENFLEIIKKKIILNN
ncbi:hypothetical protein CA600_06995 [Paenibacillus sp. VTT E-133280]|uniref:hypothetical protein n=1 Tax=Paenibacillus sp. VTT E-133280 TaxID=1986222 RepID=UPI000BA0FFC5|nr:hypothetical protein [Paenibacillus sp. VTT E-133280]OZQ68003.1 hypothetical protein CA600_06995 [Paenibacillus sp. VTT E-133280]